LGIALAAIEVYGGRFSIFAVIVQRFFRGIPPIVLLLLVFYLPFDLPPLLVGILGLGLCSAAYQSQIFRSAIQSISKGQVIAARALGMTQVQAILHVVLPQALRRAIGPWTNEFASEVKDTSLVYVVGLPELLRRARYIIAYTRGSALFMYFLVALIYLGLTRLGTALLYRLEHRLWVPGLERRGGQRSSGPSEG
jgi:polar amino acid transport system permease protein